jgi:hypothetical protein
MIIEQKFYYQILDINDSGVAMASHKRWTQKQIGLLEHLYSDRNISWKQLEEMLGHSQLSIQSKASKLGLHRSHPTLCQERWAPKQIALLKQLYIDEDVPWSTLKQKIGRSRYAIESKASDLGLRRPHPNKYRIRRGYFKVINSQIKAYLLGLIAADGSVSDDIRYVISLKLQRRDRTLLERIIAEIGPEIPITEYRNAYCISISSKEMAKDLARYRVVPRKSAIFGWPRSLPEEFAIPFILGYFDGDGSLFQHSVGNRQSWKWELLGCYDFLVAAKQHIEQQAQVVIRGPSLDHKDKRPYLYRLYTGNQQTIQQIDHALNTSGLGLPRKHLNSHSST